MCDNFAGKYLMTSWENYADFLEKLGVPLLLRKLATMGTPIVEVTTHNLSNCTIYIFDNHTGLTSFHACVIRAIPITLTNLNLFDCIFQICFVLIGFLNYTQCFHHEFKCKVIEYSFPPGDL